jgi:hypothetical protein
MIVYDEVKLFQKEFINNLCSAKIDLFLNLASFYYTNCFSNDKSKNEFLLNNK